MRARTVMLLPLLLGLFACASMEVGSPPVIVIFFGHASTVLDDPALALVTQAAARAKAHPDALVTVAGYAAANGDPDADAQLAATRAQDVAARLEQDGVAASRIQVIPRPPSNELAQVGSRRVEITVGSSN